MRVGILTSGGDCQALNATMRGLALTLYRNVKDVEIIGFIDGYKGLMYEKYKKMKPKDFYDILNVGGSILGNSRCPFKRMRIIENGFDKVKAMKNTYKKLELDCLVVLGGNGSIKSANMLSQEGLNVIALPKTIDNDAWGTDYTFGYSSATAIATRYLDEIKTTAASHSRVFVIEVMGHKVGHICLSAGIAAGADVIPTIAAIANANNFLFLILLLLPIISFFFTFFQLYLFNNTFKIFQHKSVFLDSTKIFHIKILLSLN